MKVAAAVVKKKKASFIKIKLRSTKQKAGNHTGTENKRHNPAPTEPTMSEGKTQGRNEQLKTQVNRKKGQEKDKER